MDDVTKTMIKNFLQGQGKLWGMSLATFLVSHHVMSADYMGAFADIFVAGLLYVVVSGWSWWNSVGHARADVFLKKATGTKNTADALAVAAALPPTPPPAVQAVAAQVVKAVIALLAIVFLLHASDAFAQNKLQGLAQRNDVNAPGRTQVSALVPASPNDVIAKLQAINLADLRYAKAKAIANKNSITAPCWTAWVTLIEAAQAPLKDDAGAALTRPDPHIFSDVEDASELIQSLQPGGAIQTGCGAFADAAKKTVVQVITAVLGGGAGLAGLLPFPIP